MNTKLNITIETTTPTTVDASQPRSDRRRFRRSFTSLAALAISALALGACADADPASSSDSQQSLQCGAVELYLETHDSCGAMDAVAQGDENGHCGCMLGFAYNGSECVMLGDCQCVGADCDKLTETKEECEAAHASCNAVSGSGLSCGDPQLYSLSHDACEAMDATAVPDGQGDCLCFLGFAFDGDECVQLANCRCEGDDCDKLAETKEQCEAEHVGCVVESGQGLSCGDPQLFSLVHDVCAPMDAAAAPDELGHCLCMLGFAYNGSECVMLGDCQCVGADCDKLTETKEQCEAEHAGCGS